MNGFIPQTATLDVENPPETISFNTQISGFLVKETITNSLGVVVNINNVPAITNTGSVSITISN